MEPALRLSLEDLADREAAAKSVLGFLREAERMGAVVELHADVPTMTPDQVAEKLGISRPTVSRRIKAGDLKVLKVGNRNRIPVVEFERFRDVYLNDLAEAFADDI